MGEHHIACWYIANNGRVRLSDEEFDKRLRQWLRDNKLSEIPNGDDPECYIDRSDWVGDKRFFIKKNIDKGITFITNKYDGTRLTFHLKSRIESVTFYDKEVADREKWPTNKRFLPGN